MPKYEVTVSELRDYKCTYTVQAASIKEAIEKAERGETLEEAEGTLEEIASREVLTTPQIIP